MGTTWMDVECVGGPMDGETARIGTSPDPFNHGDTTLHVCGHAGFYSLEDRYGERVLVWLPTEQQD